MPDTDDIFTFPCEFPIKAMGRASDDFQTLVVEIIKKHIPDSSEIAIESRLSSGDRYLAITATITAQSRKQLDAIYQELTDTKQIMMLL